MLGGAIALLVTGQISLPDAVTAINPGLHLFLFGMFIVCGALLSRRVPCNPCTPPPPQGKPPRSPDPCNSPGPRASLCIAHERYPGKHRDLYARDGREFRIRSRLLLLTLAFAVTPKSVMSPIGNPQNLLVAINPGMATPFKLFAGYLLLPTLVCLDVPSVILKLVGWLPFFPQQGFVVREKRPFRSTGFLLS
ncbi:MAG: hypothetical protein METHP_01824 [Methanoregula sp. SKADARSKE-2]|nr:MAG: hypothetical protein METHP_01824 [Methanoregula sp. SKADARSKE-2]